MNTIFNKCIAFNRLNSITSTSGQFTIQISKSDKENKDGSNQIMEIFDQNTLLNSIDVDKTKHGAICFIQQLYALAFSPDESKLIYVADKKTKSESFFKYENAKEEKVKGNEYELKEDWGEQMDNLKNSCICIP